MENREPPAILIIEDHEPTLKHMVRILEKEGYLVHGAANGEEGMCIFRDKLFDLILTDVNMPLKDGSEVLREIKESGADVEVIVITGSGEEDTMVQVLREGAICCLRKPIDIDQMLEAIKKTLDSQTIRNSLAR